MIAANASLGAENAPAIGWAVTARLFVVILIKSLPPTEEVYGGGCCEPQVVLVQMRHIKSLRIRGQRPSIKFARKPENVSAASYGVERPRMSFCRGHSTGR